jgi:hypothetical protein
MAREKTADNIPEFGRTGKSQNGKLTQRRQDAKSQRKIPKGFSNDTLPVLVY